MCVSASRTLCCFYFDARPIGLCCCEKWKRLFSLNIHTRARHAHSPQLRREHRRTWNAYTQLHFRSKHVSCLVLVAQQISMTPTRSEKSICPLTLGCVRAAEAAVSFPRAVFSMSSALRCSRGRGERRHTRSLAPRYHLDMLAVVELCKCAQRKLLVTRNI